MDPAEGHGEFEGREIQGLDPDKVARLGLSHVPEGREVFPFLTVRENLRWAPTPAATPTASPRISRWSTGTSRSAGARRAARRPLSGGEQQMLPSAGR